MKRYAVIVAGGVGQRMGNSVPKQFLLVKGQPVLWHSINAFVEAYSDITIIVVLPADHLTSGQALMKPLTHFNRLSFVGGGENRFQSVKNGLAYVPDNVIVLVHDGVRCLVTPALIKTCYNETVIHGNAIPAIPPADSIRQQTDTGNKVIDRSTIRLIQTPQAFRSEQLKAAFDQDYNAAFSDEATVMESKGHPIHLVAGEVTNFKITTPADLLVAENVLATR